MRAILFLLLLLLAGPVRAQAPNYMAVAGTHLSLVPPPGFTVARSFAGFEQQTTGASILVAELPTPVLQLTAGMNESALATRGMRLQLRQPVSLLGARGTLLTVSQKVGATSYVKQILLFGDATHTVMVTGTNPEALPTLAGPLKAALLTTRYQAAAPAASTPAASAPVGPAASFSADATGSRLRFAKNQDGSLLYTTDGNESPLLADKAALLISASTGHIDVNEEDQEQYCLDYLRRLPEGPGLHVRTVTPVRVNGLYGYEIVADGKTQRNEPRLVYLVMLFQDNDRYYRILGAADQNLEANLASFQRIAGSFRRR